MKIVLLLLIILSFLAAGSAFLGAGVTWTYFPHTAVGVAFYEHSEWLALFHSGVGTGLYFFWPKARNRKAMMAAFAIFVASILIHIGTTKIRVEKTGNVEIGDISYRVSSYELPLLNDTPPIGSSPFRKGSNVIVQREQTSSLHFSPKQQFGFGSVFENEDVERFFVAIYTAELDREAQTRHSRNAYQVIGQNRTLLFYPETPFTDNSSDQKFQTFIQSNIQLIEQDITARTVVNPNAP